MLRHFYIADNLDELEIVEHELESAGIAQPQIHLLSQDHSHRALEPLYQDESVVKQQVVHSSEIGVMVGCLGAFIVLTLAYLLGLTNGIAGWVPVIIITLVIFGICFWQGGFVGIQTPNINFEQFHQLLAKGKHILFVDVASNQELAMAKVINRHHSIQEIYR